MHLVEKVDAQIGVVKNHCMKQILWEVDAPKVVV
jgi:hypothetical protein